MTKSLIKRARRFIARNRWKFAKAKVFGKENAFTNHYSICEFIASQTWEGRIA